MHALHTDYWILWANPTAVTEATDPRSFYFDSHEANLKFLHASPPLISRILHIVIGVGLLGFIIKLYKPSEANKLFDGASLVLYMSAIVIYISNIVKGMRTASASAYGGAPLPEGESLMSKAADGTDAAYLGREDSLRVLAASNTICALVLVGVLVLQAGQWYAQRKEAEEMEEMDKARDEKRKALAEKEAEGRSGKGSKKKQ